MEKIELNSYIVFDLEASCETKEINQNFWMETIQIGAVKVKNGKIVDEFNAFIHPKKYNGILTDFCKNLTNIKQKEIDEALYFKDVIKKFEIFSENLPLLSWSAYDKNQLLMDAGLNRYTELKDIQFIFNHRDLREDYKKVYGIYSKKGIAMRKALSDLDLPFDETTHHNGLSDAKHLTQIALKIYK